MASTEHTPNPYPDANRLEDIFNQIAHGETEVALLDEYLSLGLSLAERYLQDMQSSEPGVRRSYEEFMIPVYPVETIEVAIEDLTSAINGSYHREKTMYCRNVATMLQGQAEKHREQQQYTEAIEAITQADNWLNMAKVCLQIPESR